MKEEREINGWRNRGSRETSDKISGAETRSAIDSSYSTRQQESREIRLKKKKSLADSTDTVVTMAQEAIHGVRRFGSSCWD